MAEAGRRERKKGVRYRSIYKAADAIIDPLALSARRSERSRSLSRRTGAPLRSRAPRRAGWYLGYNPFP